MNPDSEIKNTERLLWNYLCGRLSAEDQAVLENRIAGSDDLRKKAGELSKINFVCETVPAAGAENIRALGKVKRRIRRNSLKRAVIHYEKFAAMIAVPLVAASIYLLSSLNGQQNTLIEVRSNTGMISEVTLPDNSTVWLNSNSTLKYPVKFGRRQRQVELTGEAFFDVTHDPKTMFVVNAGSAQVEVYGTEFNVEAYPDSRQIHTTLVSGSVGFRHENMRSQKVITRMEPFQQLTYDTEAGSLSLRYVDPAFNTAWKEGKVVLNDTPLPQALRVIGNKYNVSFEIKNEQLREDTFTGTFSYQTLDMILHHFTLSSGITFSRAAGESGGEIHGREIIEVN